MLTCPPRLLAERSMCANDVECDCHQFASNSPLSCLSRCQTLELYIKITEKWERWWRREIFFAQCRLILDPMDESFIFIAPPSAQSSTLCVFCIVLMFHFTSNITFLFALKSIPSIDASKASQKRAVKAKVSLFLSSLLPLLFIDVSSGGWKKRMFLVFKASSADELSLVDDESRVFFSEVVSREFTQCWTLKIDERRSETIFHISPDFIRLRSTFLTLLSDEVTLLFEKQHNMKRKE